MPLSEKARGKQRAVDPEPEPEPEPDAPRQLLVRFTEGLPDLTVTVGKLDSARDVKSHVRVSPLHSASRSHPRFSR
jgi:hypothetical protein